jgi:hypothetical protein
LGLFECVIIGTDRENSFAKEVFMMLHTLWGIVKESKIELLEEANIPEGSKVLVTLITDDLDSQFWLQASRSSIDAIWDNSEDDIYAKLLCQ